MIKAVLKVTGILLVLVVSTASMAETPALKIGYVNVQQVLLKSPQVSAEFAKLRKEFEARQKKMLAIQSEIQAIREKATRDELTMKDSERKDLEQKLRAKDRELRWNQAIYDEDLKIRRNEVQAKFRNDIYKAIVTIAQNDKYDLILTEGVVFSAERVNLSARVLEELNKGKK